MVILHIKQKDESLFLLETTLESLVNTAKKNIVRIYNSQLKVQRICSEIELLATYGPIKDLDSDLLEEGKKGLKTADIDWTTNYKAEGGTSDSKDPNGKRIGKRPSEKMKNILSNVISEARGIISAEQVKSGVCLTPDHIYEALDLLKGAVMVVYPMNLPFYDPIRCELENREVLTDADKLEKVLPPDETTLWFAGKELQDELKLKDYFGQNEKSKVIVKLQRKGQGMPPREPAISEEEKKKLLLEEFKRRDEMKKLEEDIDNTYLDSEWADNYHMKKSFHGLDKVSWKPH